MQYIIILILILGISIAAIIFFIFKSILSPKRVATLADYVKQGKTTAAIRIAKQIIAKEPRNTDAHYFLGLAYLKENKQELALMELKTVNHISNFSGLCKEIPFRKKIADLYESFTQVEEALKEYLLLIKLEPQEADNYFHAGNLFVERNNSEKSLGYLRKAIELNPRHPRAHYTLGVLLYKMKKPLEAKSELETAVKLQMDSYNAYFYLGRILKESRDYVGALLAFEKAQRDPELKIKALVERGGCYIKMNNMDKAIAELERSILLAEDDSTIETLYARYFLAICYEKTRKLEKAIEQWEKIYAKKPNFKDVAEKLSQYQELRTDDRIKDYLTVGMEEFYQICSSVVLAMGLTVRDITDIPNGCQIIAVENETTKWRNTRRLPKLVRLFRIPDLIPESSIRSIQEEMRNLGISRSVVITSSSFSRKAIEFAESRPIDLYNKEQLLELLKNTGTLESKKAR